MRRLATVAVVAALISPTAASGQDYTFGDWARDQGYSPGDAMPSQVDASDSSPGIDSLNGIGEFDWITTPTMTLRLSNNQLSSIESGDFNGLTNLTTLSLSSNRIPTIKSGDFSGLTNLTELRLSGNRIQEIDSDDFSELTKLTTLWIGNNRISSIESGDLNGLPNLTVLGLDGNWLVSLEPGDFSGPTHLRFLRVGYNGLTSIESDDFMGLTDLETLVLDHTQISILESGDFSELTNLRELSLMGNPLTSVELGAFSGLKNLTYLGLDFNQSGQTWSVELGAFSGLTNLRHLSLKSSGVSSIESGAFTELMNLETLTLSSNPLTELNLEAANFLNLTEFNVHGNQNISTVSLKNSEISQTALAALLGGGDDPDRHPIGGIGHLDGITEMDLSGIDFADITDLEPLYVMEKLTDLWLVNTQNVDATALDILLDNLETIEDTDTEGILYMTQADFDAFNAAGGGLLANWNDETGHHVEYLQIGDVNHDTEVNGLDVDPFVRVLLASRFDVAADVNLDGVVNGLDVEPFVAAVVGGVQQIPEPSTLFLCLVALGVVGGWRKWNRAA